MIITDPATPGLQDKYTCALYEIHDLLNFSGLDAEGTIYMILLRAKAALGDGE